MATHIHVQLPDGHILSWYERYNLLAEWELRNMFLATHGEINYGFLGSPSLPCYPCIVDANTLKLFGEITPTEQ